MANNTGSTILGVFNYLPISPNLSTSGQPTEQQFIQIKAAGFNTVINLAPHSAGNSLKDETALIQNLGMSYIHLPVDFKNPTQNNFKEFCEVMRSNHRNKVWLHCAANMRVSAFLYKYRRDVLGEDEPSIKKDLEKIWQPYGVWEDFIL